ncbi:unnamed protein product [Porites evermanni]|uniref:Uncharacterized protein n=1 Tax=Porites evermanni TaxID=104178 RepID=A0ABN8T3P6_9CNID|nr:unnamed protein product [Porites evermanni]
MNIKPQEIPEKHKTALDFITYIGLGVSLLAEIITIVAYMLLLCSNNDQQSHVHMNLVATLAMAQVIFLAGIDASQDQREKVDDDDEVMTMIMTTKPRR